MSTRTNDLHLLVGKLNGALEALEKDLDKTDTNTKEKFNILKKDVDDIEKELDYHKNVDSKKFYKLYAAVWVIGLTVFILAQNNKVTKTIIDSIMNFI